MVPAGVWIAAVLIVIVIAAISIWVVRKAYSRRWEDMED